MQMISFFMRRWLILKGQRWKEKQNKREERGRIEGLIIAKEENARKMLDKGYSFLEIQDITGLPEEKILKLQKRF